MAVMSHNKAEGRLYESIQTRLVPYLQTLGQESGGDDDDDDRDGQRIGGVDGIRHGASVPRESDTCRATNANAVGCPGSVGPRRTR